MKKSLVLTLAAAMSLLTAGCGEITSSGSSANVPAKPFYASSDSGKSTDRASDESNAISADGDTQETSAEDNGAENSAENSSTAEATENEETSAAEEDDDEEEVQLGSMKMGSGRSVLSKETKKKNVTPADVSCGYSFDVPNGKTDFGALYDEGLSNVSADGTPYCCISQGSGAGHAFYKVYVSPDCGESWLEADEFQALSGSSVHFALDDGRILTFYGNTASGDNCPKLSVLSLSGNSVEFIDEIDVFSGLELDNGEVISSSGNYDFSVSYYGGCTFDITITERESGGTFSSVCTLDPASFNVFPQ